MESKISKSKSKVACLFCLLFWSFIWFAGEFWNWNSLSRLFCTVSIVERGVTNIDPYAEHTGDKAAFQGHYYSDKAPGLSLLALPSVGVLMGAADVLGVDLSVVDDQGEMRQAAYGAIGLVATACTSSLLSALAAVGMCATLCKLTSKPKAALAGTLAIWMGTPLWGWSACFFGHAPAAALLTLGFCALYRMTEKGTYSKTRFGAAAVGAFCLGTAVIVEFTAAPAALFVFLWGLWRCRELPAATTGSLFGVGTLCALPPLVSFMGYNQFTFGKWITTGYKHVVGFEGMEEGFMGLTYPKPHVLYELLLGTTPGLLVVAPVLVLVPFGWWMMRKEAPSEAVLSALLLTYYLLLNASYHYWGGAWAVGPRHVTACLPFLALPLTFLFRDSRGILRKALLSLTALSCLLALAGVSVGMTPHPQGENLFLETLVMPFLRGDFVTPLGVYLKISGFTLIGLYLLIAAPLGVALFRSYR